MGHTVDVLALCQVAVVLAGEQRIAVAAHDALDVAVGLIRRVYARKGLARYSPVFNVVVKTFHDGCCGLLSEARRQESCS